MSITRNTVLIRCRKHSGTDRAESVLFVSSGLVASLALENRFTTVIGSIDSIVRRGGSVRLWSSFDVGDCQIAG